MITDKLQRGFTLIETMIALLIFSVGLMGMAALMVLSVKTNHSAPTCVPKPHSWRSRWPTACALTWVSITSYNGSYSYATGGTDPCLSAAACSPSSFMVTRDRLVWSRH